MSTDKCVLQNEFVNFDLTKLTAAKLDDYQVPYNVMEHGKKTDYIIYINVCKSLGYSCGKSGLYFNIIIILFSYNKLHARYCIYVTHRKPVSLVFLISTNKH